MEDYDNIQSGQELDDGWGDDEYEPETEVAEPETEAAEPESESEPETQAEREDEPEKGADSELARQLEALRSEHAETTGKLSEARQAHDFIEAYAAKLGITPSEFIRQCKVRELVDSGVDESAARYQIEMSEQLEELNRYKQNEEMKRQASELRERDFAMFAEKYPGVPPSSIPETVWRDVSSGTPLTTAYAFYENGQLKAKLAAMEQSKANTQTTIGSRLSSGAEPDYDDFLSGFSGNN